MQLPDFRFPSGLLLLAFALTAGLAACEREDVTFVPDGTHSALPTGAVVSAHFYGRLVDADGGRVAGATVSVGGVEAVSDERGDWEIRGARVPDDNAHVRIQADGYFPASRTLTTSALSRRAVDIELVPLGAPTVLSAGEGGRVEAGGELATVTFPPDAFARELDGAAYDGEVEVYATFLPPRTRSTPRRMPGRLTGIAADGSTTGLRTLGMVGVELRSPDGEPLQLREGATAELRVAVPAAEGAIASVPLWSFDEEHGTWVEEGVARRVGEELVGEVSHFSWWNYDEFDVTVELCFRLVCADSIGSQTLAGRSTNSQRFYVAACAPAPWSGRSAFTDDEGSFCSHVPANATLTIAGSLELDAAWLWSREVTVGSSNLDLGTFEVDCDAPPSTDSLPCDIGTRGPGWQPRPPFPFDVSLSVASCHAGGGNVRVSVDDGTAGPVRTRVVTPDFDGVLRFSVLATDNLAVRTAPIPEEDGVEIQESPWRRVAYGNGRVDLGGIDFEAARFRVSSRELEVRVTDCDDEPYVGAEVEAVLWDGEVIFSGTTDRHGKASVHFGECAGAEADIVISDPSVAVIERVLLDQTQTLGPVRLCLGSTPYYFSVSVDDRSYALDAASGRAGTTGWSVYGAEEIDQTAPYFGLRGTQSVIGPGRYAVGGQAAIWFEQLRLPGLLVRRGDHDFRGYLEVTEFDEEATGRIRLAAARAGADSLVVELDTRFRRG